MSETVLRARLSEAAAALDEIILLTQASTKLAGSSQLDLERVGKSGDELRHALALLDHRAACWQALVDVRDCVNPAKNTCNLAGSDVPFDRARFLTTQAYLAATWATADVVTQATGRVLCTSSAAKNETRTTNIWQHFLKGNDAPWLVSTALRECFAWPIAVSYIVRNHFTHQGGVADGTPFFESGLGSDGFVISDGGWQYVLKKAGPADYRVDSSMMRIADIDPSNTRRLDVVLGNCHRELDDALGILAKTAGGMALMYATLLTE